ncbi:MAG: hypothetical protein KGZ39_02120 [Simkania sp.]|nr:hypothetical protein [Simkania sp.]
MSMRVNTPSSPAIQELRTMANEVSKESSRILPRIYSSPSNGEKCNFQASWHPSPNKSKTERVAAHVVQKTQLYTRMFKVCSAAVEGIRRAAVYSPKPHSISQTLPAGLRNFSDKFLRF